MKPRTIETYNSKPSVSLACKYGKGPVYVTRITSDYMYVPPMYISFTYVIGSGHYRRGGYDDRTREYLPVV